MNLKSLISLSENEIKIISILKRAAMQMKQPLTLRIAGGEEEFYNDFYYNFINDF